jgi:hypothetical protein
VLIMYGVTDNEIMADIGVEATGSGRQKRWMKYNFDKFASSKLSEFFVGTTPSFPTHIMRSRPHLWIKTTTESYINEYHIRIWDILSRRGVICIPHNQDFL